MAVRSQEVRGPYVAKGVRGPHATTTYEEETACRRQPGLRRGCQVHAVWSADAEEVVEVFKRKLLPCQHALDPSSRCALALLTNADLKADITLLRNIICKQKSCSFNTLTRVGARASHGSKIKDWGE